MSRKKEYIEEDVVEKAMNLFWVKGYESTSMQMLDKAMGINKFSIYSSFGSKNNLFVESLKLYRKKVSKITNELEASSAGLLAIKQYFYKFLKLSAGKGFAKGCLISNTLNELDNDTDLKVRKQVEDFNDDIKHVFFNKLVSKSDKDQNILEEQADYLVISMIGLSSASKVYSEVQLENYIENTFMRL
jgi:AcrR family transcriptional regulator